MPAMSSEVTNSPDSTSAISTPAAFRRSTTDPTTTNSSSYFVSPSPLTMAMTRFPADSGRSSSRPSTRVAATSSAEPKSSSETPGSP